MADESGESDLRRRAAWLLAMLVVAAVLVVVVMTTLLNGSGKTGGSTGLAGPDDSLSPVSPRSSSHTSVPPGRRSTSPGSSSSTAPSSGSSSTGPATATCPNATPCALEGDAAQAVAAINDYRTQHGQPAVPGTVSPAAQACALSNGSSCSGGWAETQVAKLDGAAAVAKIERLGKLLDSKLKSFEVGWAYVPKQKTYFFAIIRND